VDVRMAFLELTEDDRDDSPTGPGRGAELEIAADDALVV